MKRMTSALVLLTGALILQGSAARVARGVTVDGIAVGGMRYADAERAIRAQIAAELPALRVETPRGVYVFSYPEIDFSDNAAALVRAAAGAYETKVSYYLKDTASVIARIAGDNHRMPVDAEVSFSARGFSYTEEQFGRRVNTEKLGRDLSAALADSFPTVTLSFLPDPPSVTRENLLQDTVCLASFSTAYSPAAEGRAHNIALAASKIDGTVLPPYGAFSFNDTVGERSRERGFREANIISGGRFVPGVGGGVCQVSTTVYNCALLAGMTVTESRSHSLAVGYAEPSFDAMVSSASDLRFTNPHATSVYLSCKAENGVLTASLFGRSDGLRYERESRVLRRIAPPAPETVEGETDLVLVAPKDGIESEGYLCVYRGDRLIERRKLRSDSYDPVRGILQIGKKEELPAEPPENG